MGPAVVDAPVAASATLGAYRVLVLRAPSIAAGIRPGQFLDLAVEGCLLRRPLSVYLSDPDAGTVSVAFDAIGPGTRCLAARVPGDVLSVVGPLGHGFDPPEGPGADLVVGGGYGAAALSSLAAALDARGSQVHAVLGGRTAERVFADDVLAGACASIAVLTDDGSAGARGVVTDPLPALIERFSPRGVYACGPMPMLEAVAALCARAGVPSQLAVEEFMACGIGVCWTCVLPVRVDGSVKRLRSCTEGPVFEGARIAWR